MLMMMEGIIGEEYSALSMNPFGFTARLQLIRLITMKLKAKCAAIKPRTCQCHHTINKIKLKLSAKSPTEKGRKKRVGVTERVSETEKCPNGVTISLAWNKFLFIKHVRASCRYFWIPDLKPKLMNCGMAAVSSLKRSANRNRPKWNHKNCVRVFLFLSFAMNVAWPWLGEAQKQPKGAKAGRTGLATARLFCTITHTDRYTRTHTHT